MKISITIDSSTIDLDDSLPTLAALQAVLQTQLAALMQSVASCSDAEQMRAVADRLVAVQRVCDLLPDVPASGRRPNGPAAVRKSRRAPDAHYAMLTRQWAAAREYAKANGCGVLRARQILARCGYDLAAAGSGSDGAPNEAAGAA